MLKEAKYGGIVGDDFAGVVEELGPDVPEGMWTVGERVAGLVFGSQFSLSHTFPRTTVVLSLSAGTLHHATADQPNGAFSEYVVADAELQLVPIPPGWSFEEAAQLGVAPLTALQCLHETLELPSPFESEATAGAEPLQRRRTILIWGGASAVGQCAIQFAKLGGPRVIMTASPKNFGLVRGTRRRRGVAITARRTQTSCGRFARLLPMTSLISQSRGERRLRR
jgi:NADPH:quinone reductase-like Zn-dependent oxidoreductase